MLGTEYIKLVFKSSMHLIDNDLKALNNLRNKIKKSKQNHFIKADITDEKQLANIKEIKKDLVY